MKLLLSLSIRTSAILVIALSACATSSANTPSPASASTAGETASPISAEEQCALDYIVNIETFSEIMELYAAGTLARTSTEELINKLNQEIISMDDLIWGDSAKSKKVQAYLHGQYATRLQLAKELAEQNLDADLDPCISYSMSLREPSEE